VSVRTSIGHFAKSFQIFHESKGFGFPQTDWVREDLNGPRFTNRAWLFHIGAERPITIHLNNRETLSSIRQKTSDHAISHNWRGVDNDCLFQDDIWHLKILILPSSDHFLAQRERT
jgi:hypothetical protein